MINKIEQIKKLQKIPICKDKSFFVYFLYYGNDIVYVGSSLFVENRVKQHLIDKEFYAYTYIAIDSEEEMHELELRCIVEFSPIYNKGMSGITKSGFYSISQLKKRYAKNKREIAKIASINKVEVLYFLDKAYYNLNQMDLAIGVSL